MRSRATRKFWVAYDALPTDVQERAKEAYERFVADPSHPSLKFKRVHREEPLYSARVTRGYRALGILDGETVTWIWIGDHQEYERLLRRLK